jgi:hypothetical protein
MALEMTSHAEKPDHVSLGYREFAMGADHRVISV